LEHRLTTVQTESAKALQQQVATMAQLKQAAQIAETRLHIAEDTLNQIAAATPVPVGTTKWRNYTTQTGDTLASISQRFYGTPDRWVDVYAMNRSLLQDQTTLVAGLKLRIP
jgi:nucleoid-associated protein YgaU